MTPPFPNAPAPAPPRRKLTLRLAAVFFAPFLTLLVFIFILLVRDRTSHAWVPIAGDPVSHVAPTGAKLVASSGGHGLGDRSPSYTWLTYTTSATEDEVDRDLSAQLTAIGYVKMRATLMNPGWTSFLAETRQYRRGELTARYFVRPTPYQAQKNRTITPADAPRVVVVTVENETAIHEK